jgi:hypothetical protein
MKKLSLLFLVTLSVPLSALATETCKPVPYDDPSASPPGLSLSADGAWLAAAGPSRVHLFQDDPLARSKASFEGGEAVAIHAQQMAVGGGGGVRVYRNEGNEWQPVTPVLEGPRPGSRFGASVALGDKWLVVGAPEDGAVREGAAYVYSATTLKLERILRPGDGRLNDRFGASVAVDGNTIVVGAPYADDLRAFYNFGAAYVFDAGTEAPAAKLRADSTFRGDDIQFGASVAIRGDSIVVGAPGDDPSRTESAGSAHLFTRNQVGNQGGWSKKAELTHSGPSPGRQLGISVAIDEAGIAVGAIGDGSAYFFTLDGNPDGQCGCGGHFGRSVALWTRDKDREVFLGDTGGVKGCFRIPPKPVVRNTLSVLCGEIEGSRRQQTSLTYNFLLQGGPGQTGAIRGELADPLPANLPLLGVSATGGQIHAGASKATWKGTVGEGETVGVRVQARVWMATAGAKLCNQARVSYDSDGDGVVDTSALSDDPNVPGAADACCFEVLPAAPVEGIPALSDVALAALALLLAALSVRRLRQVTPPTPSGGR